MKADDNRVQCVVPAGDICGEGAVWSPEHSALYWTDINRFLVHRYTPANGSTTTWFFDEPVTTVTLTTDPDQFLLVFGSRVGLWSPATHPTIQTIFQLPSSPEMRFNDAGVDARGSLWAGTMRNNVGPDGGDLDVRFGDGVLYRIDPDHTVTEWKHHIGISNTVAWSPDHSAFYFGDSVANAIWRFDFDRETGEISGETPFLVNHRGAPDAWCALRRTAASTGPWNFPYRIQRPAPLAATISRPCTSRVPGPPTSFREVSSHWKPVSPACQRGDSGCHTLHKCGMHAAI
jgi:sugar lactone lactonase YvrE